MPIYALLIYAGSVACLAGFLAGLTLRRPPPPGPVVDVPGCVHCETVAAANKAAGAAVVAGVPVLDSDGVPFIIPVAAEADGGDGIHDINGVPYDLTKPGRKRRLKADADAAFLAHEEAIARDSAAAFARRRDEVRP